VDASQEVSPPGHAASLPIPAAVAAKGPITHALFRVARLNRLHARHLLRRVSLHPSQELVMMQLWDLGPQRQADLVTLLGSDTATMTRTIRRLETAGFVRRHRSEHDKRAFIIEPTAASQALRPGVERVWSDLEAAVTRHLTKQQQAQFLDLLEQAEASLIPIASDVDPDGLAQI
jgi:MarR family transcriptional regulator, organic hydroperoxide resistance regulator